MEDEVVEVKKGKNDVEEKLDDEIPTYTGKRIVTNLHEAWLQINPPKRDFVHLIDETISEGLDSI